jgi:hypothetical protein
VAQVLDRRGGGLTVAYTTWLVSALRLESAPDRP